MRSKVGYLKAIAESNRLIGKIYSQNFYDETPD
jgi:hypothetical protein